jgi:hypothetical protein
VNHKEHLDKIRAVIEKSDGGYRDDEALRSISNSLDALGYLESGYAREKRGEVLHYSDVYFSPRKHQRENGGLPQVRLWILQALDSLQSTLSEEDSSKT